MTRKEQARYVIAKTHGGLPADISFADRKKAIFDAYPFGPRKWTPYKVWLAEQRRYLRQYDPSPAGPLAPVDWSSAQSPLDKAAALARKQVVA